MVELPALPADLRDEAEATGLRLAACVRHTLQIVIGKDATAHDVSFALNLDGVIAKRIARMARPGTTGAEALTRAPSSANLRVFADRCAGAKALSPLDLDALRDAIRRFESLVRRVGPSKGALTTLLRQPEAPQVDAAVAPRALLRLNQDNSISAIDDAYAEQWGHWSDVNILAPDADFDAVLAVPSPRIMCWSGNAAGLFERSADSWSSAALEQLCEFCARLAPQLRASNCTLLLRPHARQVLCDAARCASFIRDRARPANWPIALALDPMAMLEDGMQANATDHITRTLEALGGLSAAVLLALPRGEGGSPDLSGETGEGSVQLRTLIDALVPPHIPLILTNE